MSAVRDLALHAGGRVLTCAAVLFDLDGVLVDSAPVIERQLRSWAADHGLDGDAVVGRSHGRTDVELVRELAPHLDAGQEADLMAAREAADTDGLTECPGAAVLLAALPAGRWGIVTSGHSSVARARLGAAGLPEPAVFVTAERVPRGKPAPDGYLLGARLLGADPGDCVVVEDAPAGVAAGRAAGATVLGVDPSGDRALGAHVTVPDLSGVRAGSGLGLRS